MTESVVEQAVFESAKFRALITRVARDAVVADLTAVRPSYELGGVDWKFGLFCCSALTSAESEASQEAVLRVAQGCMTSDVDESMREAAAILLERLGNRRAVALASSRGLIDDEVWTDLPAPLQLDVIRRRLELSIPANGEGPIAANKFQREFWTAATRSRWVSVSAPTSAGKSYIVKRWLERAAADRDAFRGVYVVPTRALIEEVSEDLRAELGTEMPVHTMPWDAEIGSSPKEMHVLTQERFHLLQQRFPEFAPDAVFVDEAQKFGDGQRGVLLQQVLDETVHRRSDAQVIFASPLSENPELLLDGAPPGVKTEALTSQTVTVNQNLLWVNQVYRRPTQWTMSLVADGDPLEVGVFDLTARPSPDSKRLPLVAVALGGHRPGNVVYANGAGDAEKASLQIFDALGPDADMSDDEDIANLSELARTAVHPQYALADVVLRGVAFHYGNMPQLIRNEIERLFRAEKLRYLVCTSTLLEGVNLPCRNLFARGPRKGNGRPMSGPDFWNLAGRAGRWGKEFQGNIVCVDTTDITRWPTPPTKRTRQPLVRATDDVMNDVDAFLAFVNAETPLDETRAAPVMESVFSLFATRLAQGRPLSGIAGLRIPPDQLDTVSSAVASALLEVELPAELMARHAGISPIGMQRLLEYFRSYQGPASQLLVAPPESRDAANTYVRALSRIDRFLGGEFGDNERRQFALAILIVLWMRGYPLARLIGDRIDRARKAKPSSVRVPALIRQVMQDVEQMARFQAPKYLACYLDVLRFHLESSGATVDDEDFPDVSMMLELGVSRTTEVSLMALGLSRTSTVALAEYIVDDHLTPPEVLAWIRDRNVESFLLPALVRREIAKLIEASTADGLSVEGPLTSEGE